MPLLIRDRLATLTARTTDLPQPKDTASLVCLCQGGALGSLKLVIGLYWQKKYILLYCRISIVPRTVTGVS